MATNDRTCEAKSYLGHPCTIAPLLEERHGMDVWREQDPRFLVQRLGDKLDAVVRQTNHVYEALRKTRDIAAQSPDDTEDLEALLAAQTEYAFKTANDTFEAVTMTLAALERGNLIEPSRCQDSEASHA